MTQNTTPERMTAVGLFHDPQQAETAIGALKDAGFPSSGIHLLMQDRRQAETLAHQTGTHAGAGAATGAVAGGLLGGLGGWLVGIGALAIPGVGPFIAAGAFGAALAGAAAGAAVGAVAGALVGLGVPEDEARYYEDEVRSGRTLVAVQAPDRYAAARAILRQYGAYDVQDRVPSAATATLSAPVTPMASGYTGRWQDASPFYRDRWQQRVGAGAGSWAVAEPAYRYGWEARQRPAYQSQDFDTAEPALRRAWSGHNPERSWEQVRDDVRDSWSDQPSPRTVSRTGANTMELHEEQLTPRVEQVEAGAVHVEKNVVSEQRTMDVPVTHDEVVVERHPVDRRPADQPISEQDSTMEVPVREERVTMEKQPVVYEEVSVGTRPVTETQRVSGTVRREEAHVERAGDTSVADEDVSRAQPRNFRDERLD